MNIFFADTNFFLRFLLDDIASQVAIVENKLRMARQGKIDIRICQIVIFEILFVLEKTAKLSKAKAISLTKAVVNMPGIKVEDQSIFIDALNLYQIKNVDFVDIYIFLKAKNAHAEVLSFDRDFKKLL